MTPSVSVGLTVGAAVLHGPAPTDAGGLSVGTVKSRGSRGCCCILSWGRAGTLPVPCHRDSAADDDGPHGPRPQRRDQ